MSEYDIQFEADLEKAQALSLESLALDQFRRQKQLSGLDNARDAGNASIRRREDSEGPPPALPPPPRKPPRKISISENDRSRASSPTRNTSSDLISFTSPTTKSPPSDSHASLKEYIDQLSKLGQHTEDLTLNAPDQSTAMNNQYNQRPGYPYNAQYTYNFPPPYTPMPPYPPSTPYGMPFPIGPLPNYPYYPIPGQHDQPPTYVVTNPPMYAPAIPYNQTRMASPSPYTPYPPQAPQYNYNNTNLISRPPRPVTLYPQLNQMPNYPPVQPNAQNKTVNNNNRNNNSVKAPPVVKREPSKDSVAKPEPSRDSVESNASGKSSESNESTEARTDPSNLIDFNKSQGSVRVSVLEAFDPLLTEHHPEAVSESGSVYEEYDPLDFLYGETELREPVYESARVPSPPPRKAPAPARRSATNKLYDCIVKSRNKNYDSEHKAFLKMVLDVRKRFIYTDEKTNPGHVIAARSGGRYPPNTSIKILVHNSHTDEPITFTSDVESTVEHVILTVVCSLDEDIREDMSGYMLRVWGAKEYLTPGSVLSEYDYVRECVRLEKDVTLCLCEGRDNSLARTERDDAKDAHLTLDELIPSQGSLPMLSFDNLSILLETLEGELSRAVGVVGAEGGCSPKGVFQAVKAICALAGGVETLHVTYTLNAFAQACTAQLSSAVRPEIQAEAGPYCAVSLRAASPREALALQCARVRDAVRSLLSLYSRARLLDFQLADAQPAPAPDKAVSSQTISETMLFCIEAVHCLPLCWSHEEYLFHAQIYYGTRPLKNLHVTHVSRIECGGFYPRIIFDTWLNLQDMSLKDLPRESRLVLTLYGRTERADDHAPDAAEDARHVQYDQLELGWAALQLFDYDGLLSSGQYVVPLWPACCERRMGPAPPPLHAPPPPYPVVNIEIPSYNRNGVKWTECADDEDENEQVSSDEDLPAFDTLDGHTQQQLLHLIEQGAYQRMPTEGREILWEKRQYLVEVPGALPLVLLAATGWAGEQRAQLRRLLARWETPAPVAALHLLLPCFPDAAVRSLAAKIANEMTDDELIRVLPQLAQAVRYETYEASPLAELLLSRALRAPAVAHKLFWLLVHSLPNVPQAPSQEFLGISLEEAAAEALVEADACVTSSWRCRLLLRALLAAAGGRLTDTLLRQQMLVKTVADVAMSVKCAKENLRQRALIGGGEKLATLLRQEPAALPFALHRYVHDIDIKSCSYFSSNTLPLKINFIGVDNAIVPAMFKVGDDLRQDSLVLQVIKVMDNLWLQAGLDLRMVTFQALPTSNKRGMIEIVSEAETLRAIQTEWGLTGSFKDKPIAEWLAKHNPSELEYQRARDNFTASCAGYSVATYLLGICDRHNDNIMLKTSGHLFHIDFGKFLGDAQMFGNFKRDRAPFVLTHDMVYVINGGERPTQRFQHFVELCCMAFNVVRAHHDHILDLFALMAMSGVSGVSSAAVGYVRAALLPAASNAEAAAAFARLIHSSLKSKFTPINFFLHNLAQLRASGDQSTNTSELLSFMPRTYTMAQEGRLIRVECLSYEKRYDPEKHYVYALRVFRNGQATPSLLYRSYKHFTELYQKICLHFPLSKVHSLPSGLHVGRSNIRQVAERRFADVQAFLTSLFGLADEIAHSDLVYTFFHPLLRDQQDVEPQRLRKGESVEAEASGSGSLKLSVQFSGGVLSVLILHAQSLAASPQGLPPNPYVKVYLVPDPTKETKRKTRVLKRNSHPSFMEMLEYRLPIEAVKNRSLQATVWHYDSLQENQFLGGVVIPLCSLNLRQETVAWYPLEYIPR